MSSTLANYAICNQCFKPAVNHLPPHEDYIKCATLTEYSNNDSGSDFPVREFFDFDDNPNWIAYFQKGDDDKNILFYADNMSPTDSAPTVDDFKNDPSLHIHYRSLQEDDLAAYTTSRIAYEQDSPLTASDLVQNDVHAVFSDPKDYYSYRGAPLFDRFVLSETQQRNYDSNGNADGFITIQPIDPVLNERAHLRALNIFYNSKKQFWFIGGLKWDKVNNTVMCINPSCRFHNITISFAHLEATFSNNYVRPLTKEDYRRVQEDVTYSLIRHGNNCSLAKDWTSRLNDKRYLNEVSDFLTRTRYTVGPKPTNVQLIKRGYDLQPLSAPNNNENSLELTDEEFKQHYLNCYSRTCICSKLILDDARTIVLEDLTAISKPRSQQITSKAKVNGLHPTSLTHNYDLALAYASSHVLGTSPTGGLYIS